MAKRLPVKWVRDIAKSAYTKDSACYICGKEDTLELHHLYSMSQLVEKWQLAKGYTDEEVVEHRLDFIEAHRDEVYNKVYTLCKYHHSLLHKLFGIRPKLTTADKQASWIEQRRNPKPNERNVWSGLMV